MIQRKFRAVFPAIPSTGYNLIGIPNRYVGISDSNVEIERNQQVVKFVL